MTSEKQIAANRRNAMKSTGPKTREGKAASTSNSLKHGLSAQRIVVSGEDPDEFERLIRQLEHELEPVGYP